MNTSGWLRVALIVCILPAVAILAPELSRGDDAIVVVSRPGVVFHKAGSGDVRGRGHEKTLAGALAKGYVPCERCFARFNSSVATGAGVAGTPGAASRGGSSAMGRGSTFLSPGNWGNNFRNPNGVCRCEKVESSNLGAGLNTSSCRPAAGS